MKISADKIIGISCLHGCAMLFITSLLRNANMIEGDPTAGFLIMLVISATIFPGALLAWICREDLSITKWLVMAVPYWLVVGAISALGLFLMRHDIDIRWPAFACAGIAIPVLVFSGPNQKILAAQKRNVMKENSNA